MVFEKLAIECRVEAGTMSMEAVQSFTKVVDPRGSSRKNTWQKRCRESAKTRLKEAKKRKKMGLVHGFKRFKKCMYDEQAVNQNYRARKLIHEGRILEIIRRMHDISKFGEKNGGNFGHQHVL